jgi:hypothetical protein
MKATVGKGGQAFRRGKGKNRAISTPKAAGGSLERARLARHGFGSACSVVSDLTSTSQSLGQSQDMLISMGTLSTDISVEGSSGVKRARRSYDSAGVSGKAFLTGMHDFRAFERGTWADLVACGVVEVLQQNLTAYGKARSANAKARALVSADELPLSHTAYINLHERVLAVRAVLRDLARRYDAGDSMNKITEFTEDVAPTLGTSGKRVHRWTLQFIVLEGSFVGVGYKCRPSNSIIHDNAARAQMTGWMVTASTARPPAKAADFCQYVNTTYNANIKERRATVWLHRLGFSYKVGTAQEIYNDGHQREDVKAALTSYTIEMLALLECTIQYTDENMDRQVVGQRLRVQTSQRHIISYHVECCCHASDYEKRRWSIAGKGGKMSDKSRGAARMEAAYICDAVGSWV